MQPVSLRQTTHCSIVRCCHFLLAIMFLIPLSASQSSGYDNLQVHPYIAEQAFKIWPNDANHELAQYLGNMRGERPCAEANTGGFITEGTIEEDIRYGGSCFPWDATIFFHHFYNPYNSDDSTNGLNYGNSGARAIARSYWGSAKSAYAAGNRELAYWYLGKITHLLSDVSVPAHVHRDAHGTDVAGQDSYEIFITGNYGKWTASDSSGLTQESKSPSINDLFFKLARIASYFPSDGVDGMTSYIPHDFSMPDTSGWRFWNVSEYQISNTHVEIIGDYLMPRAFAYSASLYRLFWEETHPAVNPVISQDITDNILPKTLITQSGSGFSSSSSVTLHFKRPDGTEYPTQHVSTNPDGAFSTSYYIPLSKEPGEYTWWAEDDYKSICSTPITYTVALYSGPPVIEQTPSSAPRGAVIQQWGYGFSPNETVTLHFKKPDGTEYATKDEIATSGGYFETSYTIPSDKEYGVYTWWAVDSTETSSSQLTYEVTNGLFIIQGHTIYGDETWYSGGTYEVQGSITVEQGATLTIEPGVTVKMANGASFIVSGTLKATGTTFTWADGVNAWRGILFSGVGSSGSRLENCVLEHARGNYRNWNDNMDVIYISQSSPTITGCTINQSTANTGIAVAGGSPVISNNTVSGMSGNGLTVTGSDHPTVTGNAITGNGAYGIYFGGSGGVCQGNTSQNNGYGIFINYSPTTTISNNTFANNTEADVYATGTVTTNETWWGKTGNIELAGINIANGASATIASGRTVKIHSSLSVADGGSLDLGSDNQILLGGGVTIWSYGTLKATGSKFTWADGVQPWRGISFYGAGSSSSRLENCVLEHASGNYRYSDGHDVIYINQSSPTVTGCTINKSNAYSGINIENGSPLISN
ncbi:MAG: right-handed parallel beta-helix repeat-containing protein, partial [Desulfuromonadaceae bacterium]